MGEWLVEMLRQWAAAQAAVTAVALPSENGARQDQASATCPSPGYTYSDWAKTGEDRYFAGQWVMQRITYERSRTDNCNGSTATEYRTDGPFRLYPAVPDRRLEDVNRPTGGEAVSGTPLRSSALPGGPGVTGPSQPAAGAPASAPSASGRQPEYLPSVALLVGVLIAWVRSGKLFPSKDEAPPSPAFDMALSKGLPWAINHPRQTRTVFRWALAIEGAVSGMWERTRRNRFGWITTEVLRRTTMVVAGLGRFVGNTLGGLFYGAIGVVGWLGRTIWGGLVTGWRLATGGPAVRAEVAAKRKQSLFTEEAWADRWETTKFGAAWFWEDIKATWRRAGTGVVRLFTDPDMASSDILQLGQDAGSVVCDALIFVEGVGVVARVARGAGRIGVLSEWGRLSQADRFAEAARIARTLQSGGYVGVSPAKVWRVFNALERETEFATLLAKLPESHRNTISALMEAGYLQWDGGMLRGMGGTIRPWKLDAAVLGGETYRVEQMMHQIEGGIGQVVVRKFMEREAGFRRWVRDFRNPSQTGLDAIAEYVDTMEAVEVKNLSRTIGTNQVSRYLVFDDGVPSVLVRDLITEIQALSDEDGRAKALAALRTADGTFVLRIELTGSAPIKARAELMQVSGELVNGVKIVVISR